MTTTVPSVNTVGAFSGGINSYSGQGEEFTVTLGGTWALGDLVTLTFTDSTSAAQFQYGAGNVTGIGQAGVNQAGFCYTFNNKVYILAGPSAFMSGIATPTVFNDPNGVGNGFVTMTDFYGTAENLVSMSVYQGMLAFFMRFTTLIYAPNANIDNWSLFQTLPNIGTFAPNSVQALGGLDVLFLSDTGIRSLRSRETTLNAYVTDIGSPIDSLIQASLATNTSAQNATACGIVEPSANRYWLYLNGVIYVLSYFPSNKIVAWSTYTPTAIFNTTLVPQGARYNYAGQYIISGLTIGQTYTFVWGSGERYIQNIGGQQVDNPGAGQATVFVADSGALHLVSSYPATLTQGPVTCQVFSGTLSQASFSPQMFVIYKGQVYCRDANNVYQYGGATNNVYDNCGVTIATSWLDLKLPATRKTMKGLDWAMKGTWQFSASMDWQGVTQGGGSLVPLTNAPVTLPSFQDGSFDLSDSGYHIKMQAVESGYGPAILSSLIFRYQKNDEKA